MQLLTIQARKCKDGSVELLDTNEKIVAVYPHYYTNKPDYRFKWITHNCYRYSLKWIKS